MASADVALNAIQTAPNLKARPDWDSVRFQVLVEVLTAKFNSSPQLSQTLLGMFFVIDIIVLPSCDISYLFPLQELVAAQSSSLTPTIGTECAPLMV
jgi:hypothetical protein